MNRAVIVYALAGTGLISSAAAQDVADEQLARTRIEVPRHVLRTPDGRLQLVVGGVEVDLARPILPQLPASVPIVDVPAMETWVAGKAYGATPLKEMAKFAPSILDGPHGRYVFVTMRMDGGYLVLRDEDTVANGVQGPAIEIPDGAEQLPVVREHGAPMERQAFGPLELVRRDKDRLLATVPARVVIDKYGNRELWVRDVEVRAPLDASQLPAQVPVFSRFLDGTEHPGAYRRHFGEGSQLHSAVISTVVFARGFGYEVNIHYGPVPIHGYAVPPKSQAEAERTPEVIPKTDSARVDYGLSRRAWRTLTPTIRWKAGKNVEKAHIFIRAGATQGDSCHVLHVMDLPPATTEYRVPAGVLRPGATYTLRLVHENVMGFAPVEQMFDTAPDATVDGPEELVPAAPLYVPN